MQTAAERTVQQDIKETSLARVRVHFPLRNFYARCLWIKARHTTHSKAAFPGRFLFPAAGQGKEGGSFDGDCIFLSSRWKMLRRNRPVFLSSNSRNRKPSTLNSRNHRKKQESMPARLREKVPLTVIVGSLQSLIFPLPQSVVVEAACSQFNPCLKRKKKGEMQKMKVSSNSFIRECVYR